MPRIEFEKGLAYEFTEAVLREMYMLTDRSGESGLEKGAVFCVGLEGGDKNTIPIQQLGRECTGSSCAITLNDCGHLGDIGGFHTHPGATVAPTSDPSWGDLYSLLWSNRYQYKPGFGCRAGVMDGKVRTLRCDQVKNQPSLQIFENLHAAWDTMKHQPGSKLSGYNHWFYPPQYVNWPKMKYEYQEQEATDECRVVSNTVERYNAELEGTLEALQGAGRYPAPEHISIVCKEAKELLGKATNAQNNASVWLDRVEPEGRAAIECKATQEKAERGIRMADEILTEFCRCKVTPRVYGVKHPDDILARTFWDEHLEHNTLRVAKDRTSGAMLVARKLENAGDIIREMGKKFSDGGYITQKITAIRREIDIPEWTAHLTSEEVKKLAAIRSDIESIPEGTEITSGVKKLLLSIADRDVMGVRTNVDKVEALLRAPITMD